MAAVGQELSGRYRLDALLGAGGMATVYRAHDVRLDRPVAVKVLSPNLAADPTLARRFDQEARFLAAVNNPSVVNVYDVGDADGEPFFVMELVEGETLADRIAREGALAPDEAVPIVVAIADGLRVLHRDGFVHRDVKPGNILLPPDAGAKLADFGLVRPDHASDLTAPGTAVGTLAYLAPELLRGEAATPSSDVYALGVVAYEALTGRLPYPVETVVGLVQGQSQPAPPASNVAPWLTRAFDEPLAAVLAPGDRPSIEELAASLGRAENEWRAAGGAKPGTAAATAITPVAARRVDTAAVTQPRVATSATWDRVVTGSRSPLVWLLAALGAGAAAIVLFALLAGSFSRAPSTGAEPTATSTPRASQTARATPRPADPADALLVAVRDFQAAVDVARGGRDGLRGKDAEKLRELAAKVVADLNDDNGDKVRDRARELVREVEKLSEDLRDADAARLRDAALAVERAASRLPDESGEG